MKSRPLLLAGILLAAPAARADGPAASAAAGGATQGPANAPTGAPERPAHVRASHRVDVIGPGERIETVIDRMRLERPAPAAGDGQAGSSTRRRGSEARGPGSGAPERLQGPAGPLPGVSGGGGPPREGAAAGERPRR